MSFRSSPKKPDAPSPSQYRQHLATTTPEAARHSEISSNEPPLSSALGRIKRESAEKKFTKNDRVYVSAIANGGAESDLYLAHLNAILKQVTYRMNMYKLSADYYDAKDISKYQNPVEFATALASILQFSIAFLPSVSMRTKAAMMSGALGLFVSSWNSLKNSEKLNVKGQLFKGAEAKYKDLARDIVRCIVKRKASYADPNGPPPEDSMDALLEFRREFKEKYEIVQEMQQSMNFFPPKKLVTMWLNSGILTGEKPQRMRRRRLMPETGLPPEPGEGYEVVADDDFNSDNEEWDYEDMPTQNQGKERRARRKAKRIANRKKKKEERLAAIKAKREETAKKIQDLKLKAKDPTTRAKIEKELKLAADEEAKIEAEQAASEASDAAEDAEDERGDPAEDFIGEDECAPDEPSAIENAKEIYTANNRRGSKVVFGNIEKAQNLQKEVLDKKQKALEAIEAKKKAEELKARKIVEEKKREAEIKAMTAIEDKKRKALEAIEKKKAEVELKAMKAIEETQRQALEEVEEIQRQAMESQFADELSAAKEEREAEYKQQEAAWVAADNDEPYKGQTMAECDKKYEDMKEEHAARLAEARAAQAADYEAKLEELKEEQKEKLEEMRATQAEALESKLTEMKEEQEAKIEDIRTAPLAAEGSEKSSKAAVDKKQKAREAAEERKRVNLEKKTARDLDKAKEKRKAAYKKQEAKWAKTNNPEPYDGQNLETYDKEIIELEESQAKLEDDREKDLAVKQVIENSTKSSLEEKRMAFESKFSQDLKTSKKERAAEYKMHEAAWVAAGNTEKYNGQNLEAYDEKIKELESGRLKYEKALNVLEYTMDHTDLLSDPLDDPLLLHVEVLDSDSEDECVEDDKICEEDFIINARFLINKTYHRQNMYVTSSQYSDARDQELYIPMMFLTALATCLSLAITSPLASKSPGKLALLSSVLGFVGMRLSTLRQRENYMGYAELFRSAAGEYRRMATRLEQKLRSFRSLPPKSIERRRAMRAWKPFFTEMSEQIKNAQISANAPVLEDLIVKWQNEDKLSRNFVDQPELPSRTLTAEELNEAFCLVNLGRAKALKGNLVNKMLSIERANRADDKRESKMNNENGGATDDVDALEQQPKYELSVDGFSSKETISHKNSQHAMTSRSILFAATQASNVSDEGASVRDDQRHGDFIKSSEVVPSTKVSQRKITSRGKLFAAAQASNVSDEGAPAVKSYQQQGDLVDLEQGQWKTV